MAQFIIGNALGKTAEKHPGLQRLLWRIDYVAVWLLVKLFAILPPDIASSLGETAGRIIGPRLRRKSEMFRENLSRAFPEKSEAEVTHLISECWGNAGRVLAEYPHFEAIANSSDRTRMHSEVLGAPRVFKDTDQPAVFVAAHHCNWEVVVPALHQLGEASACLYSPPTNPLLDKLLFDSRRALNCELVPRDSAAREMMRHLRNGRSAGLVIDRRIDGSPEVPFFNIGKPTSILPAKLALKQNVELIPVQICRLDGAEFKVIFHPPITVPNDDSLDDDARAVQMMTAVHAHFQDWITEDPQSWFCPKRIWPKHATPLTKTALDAEVATHAA